MRWSGAARSALATVLATALVVGCAVTATAPAAYADPVSCRQADDRADVAMLVVGDSVAQGSVDDWTWRYRLYRALTDAGVGVDMVGPRDDLYDRQTDEPGSHDYADPAFDQDHAARWGMSFATQDHPIGDLVTACRPDVVVEALGLNDLFWLGASPEEVAAEAQAFVLDARAADPAVDVVLTQLPQTWYTGAPAYNDLLAATATDLDSPASRVVVAGTGGGFIEDVDTYDPAHLSATGEVKMATGVADALASLGIVDPGRLVWPVVDNGPTRPAHLTAISDDQKAELSWTLPPGATGAYVWARDETLGEQWHRLDGLWGSTTLARTTDGLTDYHAYQFRLQAAKGTVVAEHLFSNVVAALPQKPAPGQVSLTLTTRRYRLAARWTPADGATGYVVSWRQRSRPGSVRTLRTDGRALRLDHLARHTRYCVTVTAQDDRTPGRPTSRCARTR